MRDKNLAKVQHTPEEWIFLYHVLLHSSLPHKHSPILSLTLSLLFSVIHLHTLFSSPKWPCFRRIHPPKPSYCLYAEILHLLIPELIPSYSSLNDPQHPSLPYNHCRWPHTVDLWWPHSHRCYPLWPSATTVAQLPLATRHLPPLAVNEISSLHLDSHKWLFCTILYYHMMYSFW
jgi:hypothetical protein